ncbi:pyrroloquinoline quinone biosynthesis peptide chaperone PqqD [Streptomyces sp. HMX87]|uniref:pyrroloquinoline quinone biosynthesis peptide chaperone PqqD n=1 Tax=Streptomyces sp. HMX87 TaxID=3390849 RepID=UPI003A844B57
MTAAATPTPGAVTTTAAPAPESDWCPALARGAVRRHDPVRGATLLLLPERVGVLTEHGRQIVELCDGTRSVGGIVDALAARFPGAPVDTDVPAFLARLRKGGWLR